MDEELVAELERLAEVWANAFEAGNLELAERARNQIDELKKAAVDNQK